MTTLSMTAEQTAIYDGGDEAAARTMIDAVMGEARARAANGEAVTVETADGVVIEIVQAAWRFDFVDADGLAVDDEGTLGYQVSDYFDVDVSGATADELAAAYKGPDSDGIGVLWTRT